MAMRWQEFAFESQALRDNPLGDPATRPLFVWTPPSYDEDSSRRYPSIYLLHGHFGQARSWFNVAPFAPSFPETVDGGGPEAILVIVDGFTAFGGAQWIDSPAIGRYGTYLCDEVVPFVDAKFRTAPEAAHRGVAGKSSGGFGAMTWGLRRPDLFGGLATHAGDALLEVSHAPEFPAAAQALRNLYDGSFDAFLADFRSGRPVLDNRTDGSLMSVYASAAAFSPGADGSVELPFDVETGLIVPEVWERWLAVDPVRVAGEAADAVKAARAIWVDAGRNDEYRLDFGAAAFAVAARAAGADDAALRFELFEGTHRNTNWRYGLSVPFLVERLAV